MARDDELQNAQNASYQDYVVSTKSLRIAKSMGKDGHDVNYEKSPCLPLEMSARFYSCNIVLDEFNAIVSFVV